MESYIRYSRFFTTLTVDYSGGVIISDWYTDNSNKDQALKLQLDFCQIPVQTNSLKITVHRKKCSVNQTCNVELLNLEFKKNLLLQY